MRVSEIPRGVWLLGGYPKVCARPLSANLGHAFPCSLTLRRAPTQGPEGYHIKAPRGRCLAGGPGNAKSHRCPVLARFWLGRAFRRPVVLSPRRLNFHLAGFSSLIKTRAATRRRDLGPSCYNVYKSYMRCTVSNTTRSTVVSMRLPVESSQRLKRLAKRHGWSASDASARLVEEGLRRSEFAFIDFRDSAAGRTAYVQGSTLAVWEIMLLLRSYKNDPAAVARHLQWPEAKVLAAVNYAGAFAEEIEEAVAENDAVDLEALKCMLPQTTEFSAGKPRG